LDASSIIELGCGPNKIRHDAVGIDQLALPGVDVVGTLPEALEGFDDGSVDLIFSNHFMEHVADIPGLLTECARVLRRGGTLLAVVPYFANPHYYSDPTHRTFFGLYSLSYFSVDQVHRRAVPSYFSGPGWPAFRLVSARHHFRVARRQPLSFAINRVAQATLDASVGAREFYERRMAWWWPCDELEFHLERL
jgi:SAM-dependent methyltransferase